MPHEINPRRLASDLMKVEILDLWFMISDLGFQIEDFRFRILDLGLIDSGFYSFYWTYKNSG